MNGEGAAGRQDDVGGGEVGVRELNAGVVNRMSRKGKGEKVTLSLYRSDNCSLTFKFNVTMYQSYTMHPANGFTQFTPYPFQH
jgi:hypothetical protein